MNKLLLIALAVSAVACAKEECVRTETVTSVSCDGGLSCHGVTSSGLDFVFTPNVQNIGVGDQHCVETRMTDGIRTGGYRL